MESQQVSQAGYPSIFKLNSGHEMPAIGLGTYEIDDVKKLVYEAVVNHGYRHIDTAHFYFNEEQIGEALEECFKAGIKREELFITTKLWHSQKNNVEEAIKASLKNLRIDYLDLYLIHWMRPDMDWEKMEPKSPPLHVVWGEMEKMVEQGLTRSLGVSNATTPVLLDMLCYCKVKPAVNQVELHPYFQQRALNKMCQKAGIILTAYAPLASGAFACKKEEFKKCVLFEEPCIKAAAEAHGKSPAQIVLNYVLSMGINIIPKTSSVNRLSQNMSCNDFKLTKDETKQIEALDRGMRIFDPELFENWGGDMPDGTPYFS